VSRGRNLTLIIFITLCIPIIPFALIGELPGENWLSATDDNAFLFGLTGGALLAADVLLPIPSSIVGTLLGARLGLLAGLAWCWGGLVVGNLVGYGAGRLLLTRFAARLPQSPTVVLLFLTRPVPIFAEAVTFTAGAERMPLSAFLAASIAGNFIYALVLTANGATLLPDALIGPGLIIPMTVPVLAWLLWRRHERNRQANTG